MKRSSVASRLRAVSRGVEHGLVREALMRADEGSERLRDGEGEEEVRPGQLFVQVVLEPLLGFMLLTLGAVAVATGMVHAVCAPHRFGTDRGCGRSVRFGSVGWR